MNTKRRFLIIGISLVAMVMLSYCLRRAHDPRAAHDPPDTGFNEIYNKFVVHGKIEADSNEEWQRRYRGLRVTWTGRFVKSHYRKTYLKNIGVESPDASVVTMLPLMDDMQKVASSAGRRVIYSGTLDTYDLESGLLELKDFELLKIQE